MSDVPAASMATGDRYDLVMATNAQRLMTAKELSVAVEGWSPLVDENRLDRSLNHSSLSAPKLRLRRELFDFDFRFSIDSQLFTTPS